MNRIFDQNIQDAIFFCLNYHSQRAYQPRLSPHSSGLCGPPGQEFCYSQEIVSRTRQQRLQLCSIPALEARPPEAADGLQPAKISSTLFRMRWLTAYPPWRVVRPSMAEPPLRSVLAAT